MAVFNVKVPIPRDLPQNVIDAGITILSEEILPKLATHQGRVAWLKACTAEGWPVEYSTLVIDDMQLELCVRGYWWLFQRVLERRKKGAN